jgi:hypothetical protein
MKSFRTEFVCMLMIHHPTMPIRNDIAVISLRIDAEYMPYTIDILLRQRKIELRTVL